VFFYIIMVVGASAKSMVEIRIDRGR